MFSRITAIDLHEQDDIQSARISHVGDLTFNIPPDLVGSAVRRDGKVSLHMEVDDESMGGATTLIQIRVVVEAMTTIGIEDAR